MCFGWLAPDSLISHLVSVGGKHSVEQNRKGQVRVEIFLMMCRKNGLRSHGACLLFGWSTVQVLLRQAKACIDPSVLPVET